ncbi:MAG: similar to NrfA-putative nitrite reduction protein [uncultured Thiotrichaceae bacterium]|uniref:nitrite reductase (cytochrome; ammonia-forming) n=1 Tax=uncultured Thiotrichaceae bacterium TaxID=298394 RepID=A0A6S6TK37_9GAMM|nr:MAG: similar to NrfA-putative nitrite reduction protein [uncultured Thiotrichaceae bacterium]
MKATTHQYWILWALSSVLIIVFLGFILFKGEDKTLFMPGPLTSGHHQIGVACETCHTEDFNTQKDFQDACESCHGDDREKPFDSHPKAKFTDPRNAALLEKLDVTQCKTCHSEHRPGITHKGGYTQPKDFCVHCHADIGNDRPSHKEMDFMSCNDAGCHNYHNNRALYTDFLVKHADEPVHLEKQRLPIKDYAQRLEELVEYPRDQFPIKPLSKEDVDVAKEHHGDAAIMEDWLATAHAKSGVTCEACHQTASLPADNADNNWNSHPDHKSCATCHDMEVEHFKKGKHGMRLASELSPMTPQLARLPMHQTSADKPLDCMSCHAAHHFDVKAAAVESCLGCHADEHSLAYKDSPHYALWQKELSGELPEGSGVSCASCHMPRIDTDVNDWMSRIVVSHNQNATLVPNEKMLRPACLHCHGLEFSINAISDTTLINNNFNGQPTFKTKSVDFAKEDQKRHEQKNN